MHLSCNIAYTLLNQYSNVIVGNIRPDEYWVEYTEYEFGASESLSTKVSKQFTVSGDIATCSLHLSYPGTQLRYSIESKVVVGGNEYKETSSSLTYTTTPCTSGEALKCYVVFLSIK